MKKRPIGSTGLSVTEIGFGGASIGNLYNAVNQATVNEVMSVCFNNGIRYFDTAPEYGHGLGERRMGDHLRTTDCKDYVLSTKVGDFLYAQHGRLPPENKFVDKLPFHLKYDYSYDGIMRTFEDSLQRLGLHCIDILYVHDLDPIIHSKNNYYKHLKTFLDDGYRALDELRNAKIIRAIGLGVKQWQVCAEVLKYGNYECFMLQGNYTLLEQHALDGFMHECLKKNIALIIAGPYASGILATGPVKGAYYNHSEASDEVLAQVQLIQNICNDFHIPMQAAAIQFPLLHPSVASVVVGSSSADSMKKNIEYYRFNIPATLWDALKDAGIILKHAPVG